MRVCFCVFVFYVSVSTCFKKQRRFDPFMELNRRNESRAKAMQNARIKPNVNSQINYHFNTSGVRLVSTIFQLSLRGRENDIETCGYQMIPSSQVSVRKSVKFFVCSRKKNVFADENRNQFY